MKQMNRVTLVGRLMEDMRTGTTKLNHKPTAYGTLIIDSGRMNSEKDWQENVNAIDIRAFWNTEEFAKGKKGDKIFIYVELNSYLQPKDDLDPSEKYLVTFVKVLDYGPWQKPASKGASKNTSKHDKKDTEITNDSKNSVAKAKALVDKCLKAFSTNPDEDNLKSYSDAKKKYEELCSLRDLDSDEGNHEVERETKLAEAKANLLKEPTEENLKLYNSLKESLHVEQNTNKQPTSSTDSKATTSDVSETDLTDEQLDKLGHTVLDQDVIESIQNAFSGDGE